MSNLKYHLSRQTECEDVLQCGLTAAAMFNALSVNKNEGRFRCEECTQRFHTASGRSKHRRKYHAQGEETVVMLGVKACADIANDDNVILNCFGKEVTTYLEENGELLDKCLRTLHCDGISVLVDAIYFNKSKPENQTVVMNNCKLNQLMVYEKGRWIQQHTSVIIPKILEKCRGLLLKRVPLGEKDVTDYLNNISNPSTKEYLSCFSKVKSILSGHVRRQIEQGHLYLIREREFIRMSEPVYKFGRTSNIQYRFSQYPKGSELCFYSSTLDMRKSERELLSIMRNKFVLRDDIGAEYFEGDKAAMIACIQKYLTESEETVAGVKVNRENISPLH